MIWVRHGLFFGAGGGVLKFRDTGGGGGRGEEGREERRGGGKALKEEGREEEESQEPPMGQSWSQIGAGRVDCGPPE